MTQETSAVPEAQKVPIPSVEQQVLMLVSNALLVSINGLIHSLRDVPTDRVIVTISKVMGRFVGEIVSTGDLPAVLTLRKECREAFEKALREVNVQPPPESLIKRGPTH